ncbi:MAG: hypothetical protein ONB25_12335 [candidate division KSB1 bacterium]|nr:hypothetical protein [candidate division KSB1 bacterium]
MYSRRAKMRAAAALVGWILSRLVYGVELSRLALLRRRPRVKVQWVRRTQTRWGVCRWFFHDEQSYCLTGAKSERLVVISQLPPLSRN